MTRLRTRPATGGRIKPRSSPGRFTLLTSTGIGIGGYPSRDGAISAARWVAHRSGERVDVTCERTGQVWNVSPTDV
jgi:hypothetical protein